MAHVLALNMSGSARLDRDRDNFVDALCNFCLLLYYKDGQNKARKVFGHSYDYFLLLLINIAGVLTSATLCM